MGRSRFEAAVGISLFMIMMYVWYVNYCQFMIRKIDVTKKSDPVDCVSMLLHTGTSRSMWLTTTIWVIARVNVKLHVNKVIHNVSIKHTRSTWKWRRTEWFSCTFTPSLHSSPNGVWPVQGTISSNENRVVNLPQRDEDEMGPIWSWVKQALLWRHYIPAGGGF